MSDDRPPGSRNDPETRKGSVLLSGLMLTPDDALEVFRERRAADPALDEAHLQRARDILDALHLAITSKDPERWQRVDQAWLALCSKPAWLARPVVRAAIAPEPEAKPEDPKKLGGAGDAGQPRAPAVAPHDSLGEVNEPPAPLGAPPITQAAPLPLRAAKSPWTSATAAAERAMAERPIAPLAFVAGPSPAPPPVAPPPVAPPAAPPIVLPPPAAPPARPSAPGLDALMAQNPSLAAFAALVAPADGATGTMVARSGIPAGPALPFHATDAAEEQPSRTSVNAITDVGEAETPAEPPPRQRVDTAPPPSAPPISTPWSHQAETAVRTSAAPVTALPFKASVTADPELTIARGLDRSQLFASPDDTAPPVNATAALAPHLAALDVEGYAALCAQCAVWPEWAAQIHARYGIRSDAERAELDACWKVRLDGDAALAESFRWQRERHESWERQRIR